MSELVFIKLGGSVITDKTQPETARPEVIQRLAREVASARLARPELQLLLGQAISQIISQVRKIRRLKT